MKRKGKDTAMMTVQGAKGDRLDYRPMRENEMSEAERERAYARHERALAIRGRYEDLVWAASSERSQFDRLGRWIVATCKPRVEQAIAEELEALRITCFCPLEKFRTRPRRGLKPVDIYRPYFSGYLFVRVIPDQEAFAGVLAASRLKGLMGRDGRPHLMPEKLMDALILAARKEKAAQEDNPVLPVAVDQRVVVRSGPFTDFLATVRRIIPERWRLEAEVSLFGRLSLVEMDIDSVEA